MAKSNQLVYHLSDIALNNLREFHTKFERSKVLELKRDDSERRISTSRIDNFLRISNLESNTSPSKDESGGEVKRKKMGQFNIKFPSKSGIIRVRKQTNRDP